MLSCIVPSGIRKVSDRFKSTFKDCGINYSVACALFALYLFAKTSLSEVVRCCPWTPSVSTLSRAVAKFDGNRFMRRLQRSILRRFKHRLNANDFAYAVDDTDNPKFGKLMHGVGRWHGSKGGYTGQKILVLVLIDIKRNIALPIHYAFATKKADPCYLSLIDQTTRLLGECLALGYPALPVVADSWFDSSHLMIALDGMGLTFAGELKSRRKIRGTAAPRAARVSISDFFKNEIKVSVLASPNVEPLKIQGHAGRRPRKIMAERVGMINGYPSPMKIMAVYNDRHDATVFAYYASTDRQMSGAKLWSLSRARWTIATMFRDLKQNLSFGRLPWTGKGAADLAACLPFALYVSIREEAKEVWDLDVQGCTSLGSRLSRIREEALDSSVNLIAANPSHRVIKSLRVRRLASRLRQKPRVTPAAKDSSYQSLARRA